MCKCQFIFKGNYLNIHLFYLKLHKMTIILISGLLKMPSITMLIHKCVVDTRNQLWNAYAVSSFSCILCPLHFFH